MKKIILSILLSGISVFVFGQSITLSPSIIDKSHNGYNSDDFILSKYLSYSYADGPLIIGRNATGTATSPTATTKEAWLLYLGGRGHTGTSFQPFSSSSIRFLATENWTTTANGSSIILGTTQNGTTNRTDRMTISHDGNIGIGTIAPETKLHIYNGNSTVTPNSGGTAPTLFMERSGDNYLEIASPNANERGIIFSTPANSSGGGIYYSSNKMSFRTNSNTTKMTIDDAGNVGIGVNSPTVKLHVDGDFALKKKVLLAGNGGHSNYDRAGASIISVATPANGGGGETLNGIADGVDGLIVHVYPVQGTSITLANESTASLAANRIITQAAANVTITNNGGATLIYDANVSRWRVIGIAN